VARKALGVCVDCVVTTRIGSAFRGPVPKGFVILEGDRVGHSRLNPDAVAAYVDWEALDRDPDAGVREVVVQQRKRAVGQRIGDAGLRVGLYELRPRRLRRTHRRLRRTHRRCGRARRA
jgi:hypothetical protein